MRRKGKDVADKIDVAHGGYESSVVFKYGAAFILLGIVDVCAPDYVALAFFSPNSEKKIMRGLKLLLGIHMPIPEAWDLLSG